MAKKKKPTAKHDEALTDEQKEQKQYEEAQKKWLAEKQKEYLQQVPVCAEAKIYQEKKREKNRINQQRSRKNKKLKIDSSTTTVSKENDSFILCNEKTAKNKIDGWSIRSIWYYDFRDHQDPKEAKRKYNYQIKDHKYVLLPLRGLGLEDSYVFPKVPLDQLINLIFTFKPPWFHIWKPDKDGMQKITKSTRQTDIVGTSASYHMYDWVNRENTVLVDKAYTENLDLPLHSRMFLHSFDINLLKALIVAIKEDEGSTHPLRRAAVGDATSDESKQTKSKNKSDRKRGNKNKDVSGDAVKIKNKHDRKRGNKNKDVAGVAGDAIGVATRQDVPTEFSFHPGVVRTLEASHQSLHRDDPNNEDSYILHMPLSPEGLHLRIAWVDKDKKGFGQNFLHVPFGSAVLLKSTVWHSGHYGSPDNLRFHAVIRWGKWESRATLLLMKGTVEKDIAEGKLEGYPTFDLEDDQKLPTPSYITNKFKTKLDEQKAELTLKKLTEQYPSDKILPLLSK